MEFEKIDIVPNHVAIIPDGNRRWAKARGLAPWEGHEAGAKNTEDIVRMARKLGIREFSIWGSSLENLTKRPLEESRALLRIYETYFEKLIGSEDIHSDRTQIRIIGRWEEQFPGPLRKILYRCIEDTKEYNSYFLNFFLAYSGDDEMLQAIRSIVTSGASEKEIDEKFLKQHLFTSELSPVDYLIRTGGDPHLSAGFMMWETANSQLLFPEEFYPDFTGERFYAAIEEYSRRERRLGK